MEPPSKQHEALASQHLENNLKAIEAMRQRQEVGLSRQQVFVERLTVALGRPRALYLFLGLCFGWVAWNLAPASLGLPQLDAPPFFWMQGVVSVVALLLTMMVLTTQQRVLRHSEQRAHLDLQVNLLAEQKIAKIISLLEELRRDLPIVDREDLVAQAMARTANTANMVSALEEFTQRPPDQKK